MAGLKLDYSKEVYKSLADLPAKNFKQIVVKMLSLTQNCQPQDSKKLSGYDNLCRVDCGEYRIIYSFNEEVVTVILIGKRNDDDVYKRLARKA